MFSQGSASSRQSSVADHRNMNQTGGYTRIGSSPLFATIATGRRRFPAQLTETETGRQLEKRDKVLEHLHLEAFTWNRLN